MEIATDLENYFLWCDVWDSHYLNSPHVDKIKILTPSLLDKNIN